MSSVGCCSVPKEFEEKGYSIDGSFYRYRLNENQIASDECHMYFPIMPTEELAIITGVEFFAFHPSKKELNDKFNVSRLDIRGIALFHCSFPKYAQDLCVRIAKLYNLTLTNAFCKMRCEIDNKLTEIEFPQADHILHFSGQRLLNANQVLAQCDFVKEIANQCVKMGVL